MSSINIRELSSINTMSNDELAAVSGGGLLGRFQQKALGYAVGGALGSAPGGPLASALGAAFAVGTFVATNHYEKRWKNGGFKNWRNPRRWGRPGW